MGLHGLGMLGRRHGMGRGLLNEDESEDVENDATLGRRMKVMGCKGLKCMRRMCPLRCRMGCMSCMRCPQKRMCRRVCSRLLC